jgi:molybdate transport system ATP-binding protein
LDLLQRRSRPGARFIDVELRRVQLRLGARTVLRAIDWRIRPGQRWVLMGANGAGKTQLLKLLAGDVWPTPSRDGLRRYRLGALVSDHPYAIKDELAYLGAERQDRYEHYEWNHRVELIVATGLHRSDIPLAPLSASDRQQVGRLLAQLHIESLARRSFLTLSYGERRLVLLARALAWRPKLLLLDELFNGLDVRNRERAMQALQRLSRSALPWVLSTHRLEDVPAFATHICRLEAGRILWQGRLTARRRRESRPRPPAPSPPRARAPRPEGTGGAALITLRRASVWREGAPVLRQITLDLRAGDCWLVHGANGSGKSSFMQMLYGDLGVARGGSITRAGISPGVPLQEFKRRVGFIAPELQAIYPRHLPVEDLVASGIHASVGLNQATSARERQRVRRALRRVGAASLAARTLRTLSYGQLRRVLFARALVNEPDILLLDEPYAGLDARTRAALRSLVERAIGAGATAVMTSHHLEDQPALATHELQLVHGRAIYCGPNRWRAARADTARMARARPA